MTTEMENNNNNNNTSSSNSSSSQQQKQSGNDDNHKNTITSRLKSFTSHLTAVSTQTATGGGSLSSTAAAAVAAAAMEGEEESSCTAPYTLATDDPLSYTSHSHHQQQQKQQNQQQPLHHQPCDNNSHIDDALSGDCNNNNNMDHDDDDDDVSSTEGIDVLGCEYAPKNYSQWSRLWSGRIVRSWLFKRFVLISIFMNSVIMGIATLDVVRDNYNVNLLIQDSIQCFRIAFTIELILELVHYQQGALSMGWIVFDIIVISLSWFVSLTLLVLRSFRLIRALRKASGVADVKTLVKALLRVIPKMLTIIFLILLVFYIFAVIFTTLYQDLYPTYSPYTYNLHHATSSSYYDNGGGDANVYNDNNNNNNNRHGRRRHLEDYDTQDDDDDIVFTYDYFGRLDRTAFTLFQIMTLDGWSDIAKQVMQVHPWSCLLFITFIITTTFFFTALIIAVVGEAFHAVREESLLKTLEMGTGTGGGGITMSQFLLNNSNNNSTNNSIRLAKGDGLVAGKNINIDGDGGGVAYASRRDVQRLEAKMDDLASSIRHLVRIQSSMQASLQKLSLQQQSLQQRQGNSGSSIKSSQLLSAGNFDSAPPLAAVGASKTAKNADGDEVAASAKTHHENDDNGDDGHDHDNKTSSSSSHDISSKISGSSTIATTSLADQHVVDNIPSETNMRSHRSM